MARVRTDSIFQAASRTRIQTRESECRSPAVSTHGKIQSITKRSGAREVNSVRVTARAFCLTETSGHLVPSRQCARPLQVPAIDMLAQHSNPGQ